MPILRYTTAPKEYDWGWTHNRVDNVGVTDTGKAIRLVEIEDDYHATMQVGRYYSGPYIGWTPEQFEEEVKSGYVTLTPSKEVHYESRTLDHELFVDQASNEQLNLLRALGDVLEADPAVKLRFLDGGYRWHVTVAGPKAVCDQKLVDILQRWDQITQLPLGTKDALQTDSGGPSEQS